MSFDNAFKSDAKYYGPSISSIITSFLDQVNPVLPILDIGAGQGPKEQHSIIEAILKKQNAK